MSARKLELAIASRAKEKQLFVQLRAFFKQEPLKAITAKRITDYRTWRAEQGVGPGRRSNAELGHPAPCDEASKALGACC